MKGSYNNMSYRYKPSRTAAREFAQKMDEITTFCIENGIYCSGSQDSYYFEINNIPYRVSNHTVAASNRGMYDSTTGEKLRDSYHDHDRPGTVYITAGKTRIIDIYTDLKNGYALDGRGYRKEKTQTEPVMQPDEGRER